jgi:hypothetical protein
MIAHRHPWAAGSVDAHGNPTAGWGTPQPVEVIGWQPAGTDEQTDGRTTTTERLTLLIPPGFTVDPRDLITVDGIDYQVDGPARWYTGGPFGYAPGGELSLIRVEGG